MNKDQAKRLFVIECYGDIQNLRKANQIHKWFVENVQDGIDDCKYHNEVTKEILEELLDICQRVLNSCKLIKDKIQNGYTYENGKLIPIMEDRFYYDQYYVDNIKETIDIITTVLETTDFETQMIYYVSSW